MAITLCWALGDYEKLCQTQKGKYHDIAIRGI